MISDHPVRYLHTRFQLVQRSRQLMARVLELNDKEYRLWDLYSTLFPYSKDEKKIIKIFQATDLQISQILGNGWDKTTVCKYRNKLEDKNIIQKIKPSTYRVLVSMERDIPVILQDKVAKLKQNIAKLQYAPDENTNLSNTSNKSNNTQSIIPPTSPPTMHSLSYYQQIIYEEGYIYLTADDLMWIDQYYIDNPIIA